MLAKSGRSECDQEVMFTLDAALMPKKKMPRMAAFTA